MTSISTTSSTTSNTVSTTLSMLRIEWSHITTRSCELRAARAWGLAGAPVRSLDEVLERCGYRPVPADLGQRDTGSAEHDQQLLQLVTLARQDSLAARVVLQRILPGLCGVAYRQSTNRRRRQEVLDDLISNAWLRIRCYPVERRPHFVAANLIRDIAFETLVRPTRRRSASEVARSHDDMADRIDEPAVEPLDELVGLLAHAYETKHVNRDDVDFVARLLRHGRPENLAAEMDVTPRTIRNHRGAVVHRLRAAAAAAAAA
ncbi:MAG TPA: hypothetical protein VGM78_00885 [Ilumatobacteraceae bacterium]